MTTLALREQLRQQIEILPDELVVEIADFAAFLLTRRQHIVEYVNWQPEDWQRFSLAQFLSGTENDVDYQIEDAVDFKGKIQ